MTLTVDDRDELLAVACTAMGGADGAAALDALGWWELLPHLDDTAAREAVFAVFRAQGRELAGSPALGGLLAQPFLDAIEREPGSVVATIGRTTAARGRVEVLIGAPDERALLVVDPRRGAYVVEPGAAVRHPVDVAGHHVVHEVVVDLDALVPIPVSDLERALRRSAALGRVAAAAEILGAAERAVDLAVAHAIDREQFGGPIGTFQAVRHILAWAETDCVAVDAVVREALAALDDLPARYDEVVKALAGRNGRRACERSLQVLGGIGFTAEHVHHHLHSRVLLLDALLGSSAELTHDLGAWLRTSGEDPRYAAALATRDDRATREGAP